MADEQRTLTPSAIKYLLALLDLCQNDAGARCMDIAEQLRVKKPSVHSMIENLCAAGLAEKKKYGTVFLTPEGRAQAERYAACCSLLRGRMQQTLGLNEADARSAACGACAAAGCAAADHGAAEPRGIKETSEWNFLHLYWSPEESAPASARSRLSAAGSSGTASTERTAVKCGELSARSRLRGQAAGSVSLNIWRGHLCLYNNRKQDLPEPVPAACANRSSPLLFSPIFSDKAEKDRAAGSTIAPHR